MCDSEPIGCHDGKSKASSEKVSIRLPYPLKCLPQGPSPFHEEVKLVLVKRPPGKAPGFTEMERYKGESHLRGSDPSFQTPSVSAAVAQGLGFWTLSRLTMAHPAFWVPISTKLLPSVNHSISGLSGGSAGRVSLFCGLYTDAVSLHS